MTSNPALALRIAALVANQHQEFFVRMASSNPTLTEEQRELAFRTFGCILLALGGEQDLNKIGLIGDEYRASAGMLVDKYGGDIDTAEEMKTAVRLYFTHRDSNVRVSAGLYLQNLAGLL